MVDGMPSVTYDRNLDYNVAARNILIFLPFQTTPFLTPTANTRERTMVLDKTKKRNATTEDNVPVKKIR